MVLLAWARRVLSPKVIGWSSVALIAFTACGKTEVEPETRAEAQPDAGAHFEPGKPDAASLNRDAASAIPSDATTRTDASDVHEGGTGGRSSDPSAGGANPGGASGGVTAAGSDGTGFDLTRFVGDYDIELTPIEPTPICVPEFTETHINLQVNEKIVAGKKSLEVHAFTDWSTGWKGPVEMTVAWMIIPEYRDERGKLVIPKLDLRIHPNGFSQFGYARPQYKCRRDHVAVVASQSLKLSPDKTPPKVRASSSFPGGRLFSFGSMYFWASEPLMHQRGSYYAGFYEPEDAKTTLAFTDSTNKAPVAATWETWPWGPAATFVFAEPSNVGGLSIELQVIGKLTDRAGNQAVPVPDPVSVVGVPGPFSKIDFDVATPAMTQSGAIVHPAGEANSPCESGGCVELRGPSEACSEVTMKGPRMFVAFHLNAPQPSKLRMRYRLWSSEQSSPWLWAFNERDCSSENEVLLNPLPKADGALTYAGDWTTLEGFTCRGPRTEQAVVLALPCTPSANAAEERLVIESLEMVPAPTD